MKLQGELRDQQQLRTKLEKIVDELHQQDRKALNTTDPDAGRLRNGGRIDVGYNCQAVVDERHGLIVHIAAVNQSNDAGLFSGQIQGARDVVGKSCVKACADAGYCSPGDLSKSLDQGIDVVVPITRHSDFRERFTYDSGKDIYRCPQGHELRNVGINNRNKSYIYWIGQPSLCQQCPRFGSCTRSSQGRKVEKMGSAGAPDDLTKGHLTQTWLAVSNDTAAKVSGGYWHHRKQQQPVSEARDPAQFLLRCNLFGDTREHVDGRRDQT